ncbi:MAG: HlyD family secretion protein [Rikenellaceae bacterium]|nr:HlyD family secretion protein [Rikenellaceae bacterium]
MIAGCYFIKYPQTVEATVVITTVNPPADLVARTSGRIDILFKKEGQYAAAGEPVALLYNTANYDSVVFLHGRLRDSHGLDFSELVFAPWLSPRYDLGELQSYYSDFLRACAEYRHYIESANIEKKKRLVTDQIVKNREYYSYLVSQEEKQEKDLELESINLKRDSVLFARDLISGYEYSQSQRSSLQNQASLDNIKANLINAELIILQQEQQLVELTMQQENEVSGYQNSVSNACQLLTSQLDQWLYQYLIISPIEGKVVYTKFWSTSQSVQSGERVATIIPSGPASLIGRLAIPTYGFGKVRTGQFVNVKLNGFPYMEYGQLRGVISSVSAVPEEDGYVAQVEFPAGLVSTYGIELGLIQQMDGTAEIITYNQRLIDRFLQPLRALFDKGA